jgi:hypothetical protein
MNNSEAFKSGRDLVVGVNQRAARDTRCVFAVLLLPLRHATLIISFFYVLPVHPLYPPFVAGPTHFSTMFV